MRSPNNLLTSTEVTDLMPNPTESTPVIPAPGEGYGNWSGAPSAELDRDGNVLLAYRRRTLADRGGEVRIVQSRIGVHFDEEPVFRVTKDEMDAESLERPWLVRTQDDLWRLYLSCATRGTKHWRVEMLEAERPDQFDPSSRVVVMSASVHDAALKDPVIEQLPDGTWQSLVTRHPLEDADATDRMTTLFGTSPDGITWEWADKPALVPDDDEWYSRGVRATNIQRVPVLGGAAVLAVMFDGRSDAESNFRERTGLAVGRSLDSLSIDQAVMPVGSLYGDGALRYVEALNTDDGRIRYYYEISDGSEAHEIRTEVRPHVL